MTEKTASLLSIATKLDRRAKRFALKIKSTLANTELDRLDVLENEADIAFSAYQKSYYEDIGAK